MEEIKDIETFEDSTAVEEIKKELKVSSRKERREAKRILYQQIKETRDKMRQEDISVENYAKCSIALKNLVECYEILDRPKEVPKLVIEGVKIAATVGAIVGTAVVKEKLLNSGGLDKSTEGIFNDCKKLLG